MSALCLTPTPIRAARASRRLCDLEGGVLFGQAVSTPPRLVAGLLAAAGDGRAVLSPLAAEWCALEAGEAAGGLFAGLVPGSGLSRALSRTLGELRRGEVLPEDLDLVAETLPDASAGRLRLVAAALRAFEARLFELHLLDAPAATRAAAKAVQGGLAAEVARVDLLVLDGFTAVAPAEMELFFALAQSARRTRVSLPFFPDRPDLCEPAEPFLRRLESLHELARVGEVEVVLQRIDDRAPRVAALLSAFGGGPADRTPGGPGEVVALPGVGEKGELEAAAGAALRLLERGFSPEELVVVSSAPRRVAPRLAAAFKERGLALALGRGEAAAEVPLLRLVLDALAMTGGLERSHAVRLMGSGWLKAGGAVAGLPALLDRSGALDGRGRAAAALRRRAGALSGRGIGERARLQRAAEQIEGLEGALSPLASPASARDHARRLSAVVGALGLRRRALRGPLQVAARDLSALAALDAAAEEVVLAAALCGRGATLLSPSWFRALLGLSLESLALPSAGDPVAGAVELLSPDELGGPPSRAAIVLGCGEGVFAAPAPPEPLLREPERQAINRRLRRQALATAGARRAEALHRAFLSAAAGSEVVAFAWAGPGPSGDGGKLAPIVSEALSMAGVPVPDSAPRDPALCDARTEREALRAVARLGRAGLRGLSRAALFARGEEVLARGELEVERQAAVLAGASSLFAGRVAGPALSLLGARLPEEWTASQLEAHAHCPFRAFLKLALALPDEAAPDLDIEPRDEGTLLHALMEQFVSRRVARGAWPPSGSAADLAEALEVAEGVMLRFEREGRTGDPSSWAGRREAVLHRLCRVVAAEARDHGGLTPRLLEYRFGGGAKVPALELGALGQVVALKGRLDRVDADPGRLLVIDYKNTRSKGDKDDLLDPEAFGRESFQVPTYLMVAARELPLRTLSATYALLGSAERLAPVEIAAGDPRLLPSGNDPESFAFRVVERVERMRKGEFPIVSQGCKHCPFGAVCRFEGTASRAEEEGA